jgi:ketosteroid isomerase-like protein
VSAVARSDPVTGHEEADADAVLAANARFYEAFEARDLDAMSDLWEHSERCFCTHPGWPTLRAWARVGSSWAAIFGGPQQLQFIVTDEVVAVQGGVAWVTCVENILGNTGNGSIAATNVFARDESGGWLVVGHHGSPVQPTTD